MEAGRWDTNVDRDMEIPEGESDGSFYFGNSHRILLSFPSRFLDHSDTPLFFFFPLQPRSVELAKFLVMNQQVASMRHQDKWKDGPLVSLDPDPLLWAMS